MLPYTGKGGYGGLGRKTPSLAKERDATKQYKPRMIAPHYDPMTKTWTVSNPGIGYYPELQPQGPMFTFRSTVAVAFNVTVEQLTDSVNTTGRPRDTGDVNRARHALRYALHLSGWSKNRISKETGLSRQTVCHSISTARDLIITDPEFRDNWKAVAQTLNLSAWR